VRERTKIDLSHVSLKTEGILDHCRCSGPVFSILPKCGALSGKFQKLCLDTNGMLCAFKKFWYLCFRS
jgi:hypothetical protein